MDIVQIEHLKSDDRLKLKALYNDYRTGFLYFGKSLGASEALVLEVYQDAFLALRKKAIQGKLDKVKSSLKTYLFGIGKYMLFDALKKEGKTISMERPLQLVDEAVEEIPVATSHELTKEQQLLRTFFVKLGKKCQQVLTLYYYRGLTIEEIVAKTDYSNANTVKAQKSRCLKTLKQMMP
ncbi:RNA polymerase sigma factor [Flagellimonas sp. S174]|uniref:RNA polymerase sigma factor n=1 Tax=Flagellimonas sp. S174 TaxID=3410790 RepID=UPI003BF5C3BD